MEQTQRQQHVLRIKYPADGSLEKVADFIESVSGLTPELLTSDQTDFIEINVQTDELEKMYDLVDYINNHRYEPAEQYKEVDGVEIYMDVKSNDLHLNNKVLEYNNRFFKIKSRALSMW